MFGRERVISGFSAHRVTGQGRRYFGGGRKRTIRNASPPPTAFSLDAMGLTSGSVISAVQSQMNSQGLLILAFTAFALGLAWLPKIKKTIVRTGR